MVKQTLQSQRQIETLRETLFSHKAFSVSEAFRVFDLDNSGVITETELAQVFANNNLEVGELGRIVDLFGCSDEHTLHYKEFQLMLTPKRLPFKNMVGGGFGSIEERKL